MIIDENGEILPQPFFKTPYNHDTMAESNRTALTCPEETKTQQHLAEEADINTIVNRFLKTGIMPPVRTPPSYADFEDVTDFQGAMNAINLAKESFMALPAAVRATFQNDPGKFVDYVDHCFDTGDLDPLRDMGLAVNTAPDSRPEGKGAVPPLTPQKAPPEAPSVTPTPGVT